MLIKKQNIYLTLKRFYSVDLVQLNLHETLEHNAQEQKSPTVQLLILKQSSSTFVSYSLYFYMSLAFLRVAWLNTRLIQALYRTYLKPGEVKLW